MRYSTNDILNSLSGLKRAEAPGHLYASLRAKMERQQKDMPVTRKLSLRPVFVSAVLFIFLAANILVLTDLNKPVNNMRSQNEATGINAFSEAYGLNAKSFAQ